MLLQAAMNGLVTRSQHDAVPVTIEDLVADAGACVAAGAGALHIHPRNDSESESLEASVVDPVAVAIHEAHGVPVGVTTGAWIEPDLRRRLSCVRAWSAPDYASVNLSEQGAVDVMRSLLDVGVGIEAGIMRLEDAELLVNCGLADRVTRILVEPFEVTSLDAVAVVDAMHHVLDRADSRPPRLQHGRGEVTWILIDDAIRRGIDTRVGLEDTFFLPDGKPATSNAELVRAAYELGAGQH